jgi:hypothetical protein
MNKIQMQVLAWARRLRDFLVGHDIKSDLAELTALRQELDEALAQLTTDAAAQEQITKQSRVATTEVKRLRHVLRDGHLKPIVRMSRTMKLEMNGSEVMFASSPFGVNSERLAAAADVMSTALTVLGLQFIAKGLASNFVEQLRNASKALRDAIDQRAGHFARRTGTTGVMQDRARLRWSTSCCDRRDVPLVFHPRGWSDRGGPALEKQWLDRRARSSDRSRAADALAPGAQL